MNMKDMNFKELSQIKADKKLIESTINKVMTSSTSKKYYNVKNSAVAASLVLILGVASFYSLSSKEKFGKAATNQLVINSSVVSDETVAASSPVANTTAADNAITSNEIVPETNIIPEKAVVASSITPSKPAAVSNVTSSKNTASANTAPDIALSNNDASPNTLEASDNNPTSVIVAENQVPSTPVIEKANETANAPVVNNPGITIPPITINPSNGVNTKMLALVVYNGKIYTQSTTELDQKNLKAFMGQRLGRTINSINEWNVKDKSTEELASNIGEQEVYTVKGYDSNFRIMSYLKVEDQEYAQFFDCLNGITIKSGKDIFEKLNIVNNIESAKFISFEDWNTGNTNYISFKDINILNEAIKELYTAVPYDYQTIGDELDKARNNDAFREITLKQKDGLELKLTIFKNGYVSYGYTNIYFKVNNSVIEKLWQ
jgi:hypothetical protein